MFETISAELLGNEVIMLTCASAITVMVQFFKRKGIDPLKALCFLSILVAIIWVLVKQYTTEEALAQATTFALAAAAHASLIYNLIKGFYPKVSRS